MLHISYQFEKGDKKKHQLTAFFCWRRRLAWREEKVDLGGDSHGFKKELFTGDEMKNGEKGSGKSLGKAKDSNEKAGKHSRKKGKNI